MGNPIYEENKLLRQQLEDLRRQQIEKRDSAEGQREQAVDAILNGIAGLLSGKALIYVGQIPVQVRWMHEPAPQRQPSDASGAVEQPHATSAL